jgi:hypothetical protein
MLSDVCNLLTEVVSGFTAVVEFFTRGCKKIANNKDPLFSLSCLFQKGMLFRAVF